MRSVEAIAQDLLTHAASWAPDTRLLGNITAMELAKLAARNITTCPLCGSEAWVNIDCEACAVGREMENW